MLFRLRKDPAIETERLILRPPRLADHASWARARRESAEHLAPWEPAWAPDHLSVRAFRNRVAWARRLIDDDRGLPLLLFLREAPARVIGALTIDNLRRGPAQAATVGYWIAAEQAGRGLMTEALSAARDHAFGRMDLSRLEAACLPENARSRRVLERCGFKYEGVAQAYLQIAGRWRNHVLYAALRADRRGRVGG
ncbi:ribosomal-protein-alanine N-acetyltransferase [Oceanicella actignis]|nr:GNAT family protein [Oceanicella actignis]TYO89115.1 ribosomal-protein-alanine N-acetyltransferase [Oceanicella actignis]